MPRPVDNSVTVSVVPDVRDATTEELCRKQQETLPQTTQQAVAQSKGHHHVHASVRLEPAEIYHHVADAGAAKLKNSVVKEITMGVLAGCYIALGFSLCMLAGGQLSKELRSKEPGLFNFLFGIFGFPMGLTLCVLNGASLFTSNCVYMTCAYIEGKANLRAVARILLTSYFANMCGALLVMQLMLWGDVFHHREGFSLELSLKKTSYDFGPTLVKGILCNWLVCLAIWQGNAANDVTGVAIGIFLPNSAFVAMGFEHSIANMYAIPLAMKLGQDFSVGYFLRRNLVPVTIGNLVGGCLFVAVAYGLVFGRWEKVITSKSEKLYGYLREKYFRQEDSVLGISDSRNTVAVRPMREDTPATKKAQSQNTMEV